MANIITLTINPAIDKSCSVDRVVAEHKLRCGQPQFDPGGGGINVARVVCELGGRATAYWTSGGPLGDFLGQLLDQCGVPHQPVPVAGMTRENFIVYEESSTHQYRFGMPGPELTAAEAERCLNAVVQAQPPADYLVLSGSLPPGLDAGFYAEVSRQAPSSCRVIVDTSGESLRRSLQSGLFLIKPNLRELGQLVGRNVENDPDIENAAREIVRSGHSQAVVVSLGSGGAILATADGTEPIRSPTVPIRSKVGAGDSTVGGLVFSLARGDSLSEAARYGVAAGAACVMTPGTQLCRRDDAERLYRQMRDE